MVVAVHGSQTQNSVPEDGFNETTHHVLLHDLSSLPLPKHVQHFTLIAGHNHLTPIHHPDEPDLTRL